MVLHRPQRQSRERRHRRLCRGRVLLVGALLTTTGCIPSSSKYPYRETVSDSGTPDLDAGVRDGSAPDSGLDASGCVPPTDDEMCAEIGAECGPATETDRCGTVRTIDCGGCTAGGVCTVDNQCCQQQNNTTLCEDRGAQCGALDAIDNCGVLREAVPCGTCANPGDCEGTTCGACVRESDLSFCSRFGKECGEWTGVDNCGENRADVPCGACRFNSECTSGLCVCPTGTVETACDDDLDNDCDGLTDCQDPDCDGRKCGIGIGPLFPKCADLECPG